MHLHLQKPREHDDEVLDLLEDRDLHHAQRYASGTTQCEGVVTGGEGASHHLRRGLLSKMFRENYVFLGPLLSPLTCSAVTPRSGLKRAPREVHGAIFRGAWWAHFRGEATGLEKVGCVRSNAVESGLGPTPMRGRSNATDLPLRRERMVALCELCIMLYMISKEVGLNELVDIGAR